MAQQPLLHILLVDDEDSFRMSIEMGLRMTDNFVVESCDSGESAVELLARKSFDVILLDNRMGEMSGMDVLEWMHKQKLSTPVILVTAASSESTAVEALQLGVYDYIRKDHLDVERLSLAVRSVHERYLYRKQIIENEAKERLLLEKQHELDSLHTFHDTVNTVGQLVEKSLAESTIPSWLQPHVTVNVGHAGYCAPTLLPRGALVRAPHPKHRMRILKRDNYRCRVCGRSPNDHVDLELHVHHIRPWALGGATEDGNLVTLCHTCHNGLDPQYDYSLFSLIPQKHGYASIDYWRAVKQYQDLSK